MSDRNTSSFDDVDKDATQSSHFDTFQSKRVTSQFWRDKKKQTNLTLKWLSENYCMCEGVCLPRCILYSHYLDFCRRENVEPACAATFGKTIRQKFPNLTTRRLGTRGHSKYHYYGIGIRESSQYYKTVSVGKGLTRYSGCKAIHEHGGGVKRKYSLSSKTGTLLPDFPQVRCLSLPPGLLVDKVETFTMMYRTHCQCLLDMAIGSNFDEIQVFLLHFWQGIPDHLNDLVYEPVVVDLVCLCDSIFYKVLSDVLIPPVIQEMPETLLGDISNLTIAFEQWVTTAMDNFPPTIMGSKLQVLRRFVRALKRHTAFLHLAQTARPLLEDSCLMRQIVSEVQTIADTLVSDKYEHLEDNRCTQRQYLQRLTDVLSGEQGVEGLVSWLDEVVEANLIQPITTRELTCRETARCFLLDWFYFGTNISQIMTLNDSPNFTAYHVIRLLLDEYMMLAVETRVHQEEDDKLQTCFRARLKSGVKLTTTTMHTTPGTCFVANKPLTPHEPHSHCESTTLRDARLKNDLKKGNTNHFIGETRCHSRAKLIEDNSQTLTPPISPTVAKNNQSGHEPVQFPTSCDHLDQHNQLTHYHCIGTLCNQRTQPLAPFHASDHSSSYRSLPSHGFIRQPNTVCDVRRDQFFHTPPVQEWGAFHRPSQGSAYLPPTHYTDFYPSPQFYPQMMTYMQSHEAMPSHPAYHVEATDPLNILDKPSVTRQRQGQTCTTDDQNTCRSQKVISRHETNYLNQGECIAMELNPIIGPGFHYPDTDHLPPINTVFMS